MGGVVSGYCDGGVVSGYCDGGVVSGYCDGGVVSGYKDHNGLASGVVPSFTTGQSRRFLINITQD